jgi:hypothetical protein
MRQILLCLFWCSGLFFTAAALSADEGLVEKSKKIQQLLFNGMFDEAEPLVRDCLRQAPEEIYFLSQLDMVLNGQGKYHDADAAGDRIRTIWVKKYKDKWLAKGAPISESSWSRMMSASRDYYVSGAEYFMPRVLEGKPGDPLALIAFYKVIALPKQGGGPARIFQLDKAKVENYYFLEEYARAITRVSSYRTRPDIRTLVSDTVSYLDQKMK